MKNYEKLLLKKMHYEESDSNNEPLKDVREAMGKIAYVPGNPLTKTEITLNIEHTSFSADGSAPLIPVYLFGLTDYYSGYPNALRQKPLNNMFYFFTPGTAIYYFGIVGKDITVGNANGFSPQVYTLGDFMLGTTDTPGGVVNRFSAIRVNCQNVAYGTFLNSFVSDLITINTLRLIVPIAFINQFINPLTFSYQTLFGRTFTNDVDPRNYITSTDFQQQICDIPINLPIDKALGLSFYLNFNCPSMQMILFVEKVEPLTHKK
jgi:hypothetical protein